MKFYGKGVIWDAEKNTRLCRFEDGVLETDDPYVIGKLVALKVPCDDLKAIPKQPAQPQDDAQDEDTEVLRAEAIALGIRYADKMGKAKLIKKLEEARA